MGAQGLMTGRIVARIARNPRKFAEFTLNFGPNDADVMAQTAVCIAYPALPPHHTHTPGEWPLSADVNPDYT